MSATGAGDVAGRAVLVVSPHFDDVPLSLGQSLLDGSLAAASRVDVRVVFGRTNWCLQLHPTRRRARVVTAWRRAEEAAAARRFGYRIRAEPLEEAILRTGTLDAEEFRSGGASGDPLVGAVEALLWQWRTEADVLWMPAGVGRHVDHEIVAAAGARLAAADPSSIAFYEERPYTSWLDLEGIEAQVADLGLDLTAVSVSGAISADTQRSVGRIYRSQIDAEFESGQRFDRDQGRTERVWVPALP